MTEFDKTCDTCERLSGLGAMGCKCTTCHCHSMDFDFSTKPGLCSECSHDKHRMYTGTKKSEVKTEKKAVENLSFGQRLKKMTIGKFSKAA